MHNLNAAHNVLYSGVGKHFHLSANRAAPPTPLWLVQVRDSKQSKARVLEVTRVSERVDASLTCGSSCGTAGFSSDFRLVSRPL